jgi:hypothetical protein
VRGVFVRAFLARAILHDGELGGDVVFFIAILVERTSADRDRCGAEYRGGDDER